MSKHQTCKVNINDAVLLQIQKSSSSSSSSDQSKLVGSIDQGTSSTRFLVFTNTGDILASAQVEHTQIFPPGEDTVGWHEHDPMEIWSKTQECLKAVMDALSGYSISDDTGDDDNNNDNKKQWTLEAIGITNQRETTIAWNAKTGKVYYNAIVWDDTRTTTIANSISQGNVDIVRSKTGLPMASYFAGTKVRWLLDNVPELQNDLMGPEREFVRFGTIDTWLVYQLTGSERKEEEEEENGKKGNVGGLFITDVTNASRWLFMNIHSCEWDPELIETVCGSKHKVPYETCLPQIQPSSHVYGKCSPSNGIPFLSGVPIAAILGDQQAALFGQTAFSPGQAKCTYGTGLFLMMNTQKLVPSTQGLLTTVAYQLSKDSKPVYALEGSVSHSGSVIQWLRDQLTIIQNAPESEILASQVKTNEGLYFVPAFAGLFAPYWRSDARGCIVGMTASHTKHHICRAALEATAYQCRELLDAIALDSGGVYLKELKVDGGATANKLLMQFQCDMLNANVICPKVMETTALGAAYGAGLAVGVWKSLEEIQELWAVDRVWEPKMDEEEREKYLKGWKKAVTKSFGWVDEE